MEAMQFHIIIVFPCLWLAVVRKLNACATGVGWKQKQLLFIDLYCMAEFSASSGHAHNCKV